MNTFALFILIFAGFMIATQATLNGALGRSLGLCLFTFVFSLMQTVFSVPLLFKQPWRWDLVLAAPWWQHIGSLLGVFILLSISHALPKVGTFTAMVCLLVGQMSMGVLIDQFGWFGMPVQTITPAKILGLMCLGVGVYLIKQ